MESTNGFVSVQSVDLPYFDLNEAISLNADGINFDPVEKEANRGFQDVEWIMFALMSLPATDSLISIVRSIKDAIKSRVARQMSTRNITKNIKVNVKISLPFYSYEKEEEIIISSSSDVPKEEN